MVVQDSKYKYRLNILDNYLVNNVKAHGCIRPVKVDSESFPCGSCYECQKKRRLDWSFRLGEELKHATTAKFITLTYDDDKLPRTKNGYPTLNKRDIQIFMKRIRNAQRKQLIKSYGWKKPIWMKHNRWQKLISYKLKKRNAPKIRYYYCGEYGSKTNRPHYHAIIFNTLPDVILNMGNIWDNGFIRVDNLNPQRINYTTKYMLKQQFVRQSDQRVRPFANMSLKPAIGYQYLEKMKDYHYATENLTVRNINGNFQFMPRYYRDRIFTDVEERKKLIEEHITEYLENQLKELMRMDNKGKLTIDLEISRIKDKERQIKNLLKSEQL